MNSEELKARIAELEAQLASTNHVVRENKGIGKYVMENLRKGTWKELSNKDIAKLVSEHFQSETTPACIAWYKNKLRKTMKAELEALKQAMEAKE